MTEFTHADLSGARFQDVRLTGAQLHDVDLTRARLRMVDLSGARIVNAKLHDVEITGWVHDVRVNGVDVVPLVLAELDRRDPERVLMRPTDAAGFRAAWELVETRWAQTVERARRLPPELLHERVEDEWSFIETLRHLVFATDAWALRAVLGDPVPYDPLDLPHDEMPDTPNVPRDREVRPSLERVLALRADRFARVRALLAGLSDVRLDETTEPISEPGYPDGRAYPVSNCLLSVLGEEWEHRSYAERDLGTLEATLDARVQGATEGGA